MTEPFFLVWCPTSHRPPTVKHPTHEAASNEAKRLANANVEQDFHVLQYVGTARAPKAEAAYSQLVADEVDVAEHPQIKVGDRVVRRRYMGRSDCYGTVAKIEGDFVYADDWSVGAPDGCLPAKDIELAPVDPPAHASCDFKAGDPVVVRCGGQRWEAKIVCIEDDSFLVTYDKGWSDPRYGDGRYMWVFASHLTKIEKPWTPEGEGWIEHDVSRTNPVPGAMVEWLTHSEREGRCYIRSVTKSEHLIWSFAVAYRVVESAKPPRTLAHGEYQVGDRVRYTARAADVGDLSRVGVVGVVTGVKGSIIDVKWDDGITRPNGPLPENIEHESLPQFKVGDRVRVKAGGLFNVPLAAGREAQIENYAAGYGIKLRFYGPFENRDRYSSNIWYGSNDRIELVRPVQS